MSEYFSSTYVQGLNLKISGRDIYLVSQQQKFRQERTLVFVLEGRITLLLEGQPLEAQTGETVTVPNASLHALQNNSDTPSRVLLIALSELRETYPFVVSPLVAADLAGAYD